MRNLKLTNSLEPWRIIVAVTTDEPYYEKRLMLIHAGEHSWDNVYAVVEGEHCSCYSFNDVEFYATEYTQEELMKLADDKLFNQTLDIFETRFWTTVKEQVSF